MGGGAGVVPGRAILAPVAFAVASAVVCLGALAGAAAASKATPVKTTVKIASTSPTLFTGKVTSKKACEKGRKVTLYRQETARAGSSGYSGYERQGTAKTDAHGNWEIEASEAFLEGTYRAAVAPMKISSGGTSLMCSSAWGVPRHA
ncbi:MAG TPA: hypothetical protein VHI77_08755 [Solirubrobacterales bacterium]|nr:hypothetical protein [Solirubrobacterales bacterium]